MSGKSRFPEGYVFPHDPVPMTRDEAETLAAEVRHAYPGLTVEVEQWNPWPHSWANLTVHSPWRVILWEPHPEHKFVLPHFNDRIQWLNHLLLRPEVQHQPQLL